MHSAIYIQKKHWKMFMKKLQFFIQNITLWNPEVNKLLNDCSEVQENSTLGEHTNIFLIESGGNLLRRHGKLI